MHMCVTPNAPRAPTPPPAAPEAPRAPTPSGTSQADADRRRRAAAAGGGAAGTILTGPRGVTEVGATTNKTLLGT